MIIGDLKVSMKFALSEILKIIQARINSGSEVCLIGSPNRTQELTEYFERREIHLVDTPSLDTTHLLLFDALEHVPDVYDFLKQLHATLSSGCRITNVSFGRIWRRQFTGKFNSNTIDNWIPPEEIVNLMELAGFEVVSMRQSILLPIYFPVVSRFVNRWIAPLPFFRWLTASNVISARKKQAIVNAPSLSIVIAARNEAGNIGPLIDRIPRLLPNQEVIFVEGNSHDTTWETIQEEVQAQRRSDDFTVRAYKQVGKGKGDAVRLGFSHASGDIFMILDADISVEPEELHKFSDALLNDSCEFANGTRLVYPLEHGAMRTLNILGNRLFGLLFSFLLDQHLADTLCGTKVLWRRDYERIAEGREYFGDFDPFGDFDLLFGASRLNLQIRDIPIHYKSRTYGSTNISRFRHGLLLFRMTGIAARRLKFI